jgi:hypothetical protein
MAIWRWTKAGLLQFTNVADMSALLALVKLKLYSNNIGFDWNRVVGDLVEAAYTGYAPIGPTLGVVGPYADPVTLNTYMKLPMVNFPTCTALPETEYGAYIVDTATGLVLYGMVVFDEPQFVDIGDTLRVNILFGLGEGAQQSSTELDAA